MIFFIISCIIMWWITGRLVYILSCVFFDSLGFSKPPRNMNYGMRDLFLFSEATNLLMEITLTILWPIAIFIFCIGIFCVRLTEFNNCVKSNGLQVKIKLKIGIFLFKIDKLLLNI